TSLDRRSRPRVVRRSEASGPPCAAPPDHPELRGRSGRRERRRDPRRAARRGTRDARADGGDRGMRRLVVLACLVMAAPAAAQAQPPPVRVDVEALFGEGMLLGQRYTPVLVTLENRTSRDLAGELDLRVENYEGAHERHRVTIDLPARQARQVNLTIHIDALRSTVSA